MQNEHVLTAEGVDAGGQRFGSVVEGRRSGWNNFKGARVLVGEHEGPGVRGASLASGWRPYVVEQPGRPQDVEEARA